MVCSWACLTIWVERVRISSAPEIASFRHLDQECRSRYDADPICLGLRRLALKMPSGLATAFQLTPKRLLKVSKLLGCLKFPQLLRVLACFREHPLNTLKLGTMSDRGLAVLLDAVWNGKHPNPVPKAWWAHVDGSKPLLGERYAHYRREMRVSAVRLWLDVLEALVRTEIDRNSPNRGLSTHTKLMALSAGENKRPLRKFLRAWPNEIAHPDLHPVNRRWLEKLPARKRKTWTHGPKLSCQAGADWKLSMQFERDPEELLKIGSYVGSCMSLGAFCAYNAAAVLLDANKRVIFARDEKGAFVGRQIVAISNEGELLCFPVYTDWREREITQAFLNYDLQLASALGIPCSGGEGYKLDLLLAHEWYDDGAIDPVNGPASQD